MEELHSTENLEKEILDDADRKAARIKKAAEEQLVQAKADAEKRIETQVAGEKAKLDSRLAEEKNEIETALRLGRTRIYLEKVNSLLDGALKNFLGSLSREETLGILQTELDKRAKYLTADGKFRKPSVTYRDLKKDELDFLISKSALSARSAVDFIEAGPKFPVPGTGPALIIDDGAVKITASVDIAARAMLLDKRQEFMNSLIGTEAA
jgi:vacuolar-type H+-ATPase subunit E/Vma4